LNPVLILGGAHIDRKGAMEEDYFEGASIPGTIEEVVGGGAFNVAANLSRLKIDVSFISPRAKDVNAAHVAKTIEQLNIKDKPITCTGNTPSYTALLDRNGELIAALADMKLYDDLTSAEFLTDQVVKTLEDSKVLITDANLPKELLIEIAQRIPDDCHWYAIAVSPAKVMRYLPVLDRITCLAMNMNEAKAITKTSDVSDIPQALKQLGLHGAIITDGANDITAFLEGDETIVLTPSPATNILDVTGAGDATLSGFVTMIETDHTIKDALEFGMAAARLTIGIKGAQHPSLTYDLVQQELAQTR
jgi:pseudouridine kinase